MPGRAQRQARWPLVILSPSPPGRLFYPDGLFTHWYKSGYVSGAGCSFDWAMRTRCNVLARWTSYRTLPAPFVLMLSQPLKSFLTLTQVHARWTWYHTALPWDPEEAREVSFNLSALVTIVSPLDHKR